MNHTTQRWIAFCCLAIAWMNFCCNIPPVEAQSPQASIDIQVPSAKKILDAYRDPTEVSSKRTLHVVYWTPSDREPIEGYRERLTRVLMDIREFYRSEMIRIGFGDMTFPLDMEADGLLRLHLVRGAKPYSNYNVESGHRIRSECLPILTAAGIDADKETIVLFCNMSIWDSKAMKMSQNSPYYASGGLRNGTAWQVDSALLDSARLPSKEPFIDDGQYGRISVGKYNSIFVGGVCHELGHALGLPHNMETPAEASAFGTSLMGSGNRTYGNDRRNEGRGSFLTLADALRLASHPLFTSSEKGIDLAASSKLEDIEVRMAEDAKSFRVFGRVTGDPPPYALIGYVDPAGNSDYDATTTTSIPNANGAFELVCSTLKAATSYELRIVVCQANGGRINDQSLKVPFSVDASGKVDITSYISSLKLAKLISAIRKKDPKAVQEQLDQIELQATSIESGQKLVEVARSLAGTLVFQPGPAPAAVTTDTCWLSESTAKTAKVGWLRPTINRLPNDTMILCIGGELFARGLYAHAPSKYVYDLGSKWKQLAGVAGLADSNTGTVIFVISGDGKELWRSKKSNSNRPIPFNIDVDGIEELTLEVEDAGDGNTSDWGIWTDLLLQR